MECPRCKSPLIVVEFHDIELDWCPSCEGLWFDSGEMELLAAQMRGAAAVLIPQEKADTTEKRLKCPECNRAMDKRLLGESHQVIADICPACGGLWLDHGELEQVVRERHADTNADPVVAHLRGTFSNPEDGHAGTPEEAAGDSRK